jgi:hypothetical protein
VYRAWSKKSLTPAGIVTATLTAIAHAYHPWNLPFALLCVFFLAGTRVTHVSRLRCASFKCLRLTIVSDQRGGQVPDDYAVKGNVRRRGSTNACSR